MNVQQDFQGEITQIRSSRGKKMMQVQLASNTSLDTIDAYSGQLCTFTISITVPSEVEVDEFTGEVLE